MRIFLTKASKWHATHCELIEGVSYPQRVFWDPDTYKNVHTGLFYPPHKVAERVLSSDVYEHVAKNPVKKTAFILAGGNCIFGGEGRKHTEKNKLSYEYKFIPLSLTHVWAGRTASTFGSMDHIASDATACVSGLKVLLDVQNLIKFYGFDRVIVLAVEDQVNNMTLQFFGESGACLTEKTAQDEEVLPSAFDSKNFGFYIGQGAAIAVFDSEKACMQNGSMGVLELLGAWTAAEHDANAIGQREDGLGFKKAISGALEINKLMPEQIKIVKTHGTGTKSNNLAEQRALKESLPEFVATSYKPKIGHTMGASGLLETLLLADDLEAGLVPEIQNRTEEDAVFLSSAMQAPDGLILSLAAGMGNVYSAAIFNREV
jgi:3-oxoacyl-(acyl-carrier-protein) synthase